MSIYLFKKIRIKKLKFVKNKKEIYKNYIGIHENYSDFNQFYINKMMDLDEKYESIMNNTAIAVVSNSKILTFLRKLKALLSASVELKK